MKKKYYKTINYQQLFFATLKKKYFSMFLGIFASIIISSFVYKSFFKKISFNLSFSLPKINLYPFSSNIDKKSNKAKTTKTTNKVIYIVQQGDDLWHIGEKFYKSGFNAYDIALANKIDSGKPIEVGQKLIIPSVKPRQQTIGEISSIQTSQVIFTEEKYVVQPGDSLSLIAQKAYGDLYLWPKILRANNLTNPDQIEVGMILNIPR